MRLELGAESHAVGRKAAIAGATVAGATAALLALVAAVALPARWPSQWSDPDRAVPLIFAAWLIFAVGAWLVCRAPLRTAVALILIGGVALQLASGFSPPRSSDDLYRYVWDGRVQAAGVNAYRFVPAAPELVHLRDDFLWPERSAWCVDPGAVDPDTGRLLAPGCSLINRPAVHTIYPPVAEALFLAVDAVSPPGGRYLPIQLTISAFAVATTILLLVALRSLRMDPRRAVLWAWCPTVALEAGSNSHVDVVAVFLAGLALVGLARARTPSGSTLGGALLGLAIACKPTPALLVPSVLRRRPVTVLAAAAGAVAAVYLPHVLAVGTAVLGYLPGYLREEGYADGGRFALLTLILPEAWATAAAAVILATVAVLVARAADPDRPWLSATTMTGVALLVITPSYPWYALLLILLVALGGRVEWLAVAVAGYLAQYSHDIGLSATMAQRIGYGAALAVILVGLRMRRRSGGPYVQSVAG